MDSSAREMTKLVWFLSRFRSLLLSFSLFYLRLFFYPFPSPLLSSLSFSHTSSHPYSFSHSSYPYSCSLSFSHSSPHPYSCSFPSPLFLIPPPIPPSTPSTPTPPEPPPPTPSPVQPSLISRARSTLSSPTASRSPNGRRSHRPITTDSKTDREAPPPHDHVARVQV